MNKLYGVEPRIVAAGRPESNGQAEIYVKQVKEKMRAIMTEHAEDLPTNWDQTIMHSALQTVRSDPSRATGFAPGEILLGRRLVFPIELNKMDIDFEGTELTKPLVDAQQQIHDSIFGKASKKIAKWQEAYAKQYDKKSHINNKAETFRKGMNVQYRRHKNKKSKGKGGIKWYPYNRPLKIHSYDRRSRTVYLRDPQTGKVQNKSHPIERIRRFKKL